MIIDDFNLLKYLKPNIQLYVLSENSFRSRKILYIIKYIIKKQFLFINIEDKSISDFDDIFFCRKICFVIEICKNDSIVFKRTIFFINIALKKSSSVIIILNEYFKENILYILKSLTFNYLVIRFNTFDNVCLYKWFYQFSMYKNLYINKYQLLYIINFFGKDLCFFISSLNLYKNIKKNIKIFSLKDLLLISNQKIYKSINLLNKTNRDIFYNLYLYKNLDIRKDYINSFHNIIYAYDDKKFYITKLDKIFINLILILLDINIKKNNIGISWLLIFNIITRFVFKNTL